MSAAQLKQGSRYITGIRSCEYGAGKAMLAAFTVKWAARLLDPRTNGVLANVTLPLSWDAVQLVKPLVEVRAEYRCIRRRVAAAEELLALSEVEAAKAASLVSLMSTSVRTVRHKALKEFLRRLCASATFPELQRNEQALLAHLESEHQQVLLRNIKLASINSAIKAGFPDVRLQSSRDGLLHWIAREPHRGTLSAEIHADAKGRCRFVTKAFGGEDVWRDKALDEFERALEIAGLCFETASTVPAGKLRKIANSIAGLLVALRLKKKAGILHPARHWSLTPRTIV